MVNSSISALVDPQRLQRCFDPQSYVRASGASLVVSRGRINHSLKGPSFVHNPVVSFDLAEQSDLQWCMGTHCLIQVRGIARYDAQITSLRP